MITAAPQVSRGEVIRRRSRRRVRPERLIVYLIGIVIGLLFLFPIFFAISTSLKTPYEALDFSSILPRSPQWKNYSQLFSAQPFARWLLNTLLIAVLATAGTVVTGFCVAYSFARFRYPGRNLFFMVTIATLALPVEATIVPNYLLFRWLGWLDSYLPLIVPFWLGGGPFFIFLFRQFLMAIPRDFDEAARVDGANELQVLWYVLVPMCKPVIITATVISFVAQWNEFFLPLVYLNSSAKNTVSLGLAQFADTLQNSQLPEVNLLMAGAVVTILPPLLLFMIGQRYFVNGVITSGLKG